VPPTQRVLRSASKLVTSIANMSVPNPVSNNTATDSENKNVIDLSGPLLVSQGNNSLLKRKSDGSCTSVTSLSTVMSSTSSSVMDFAVSQNRDVNLSSCPLVALNCLVNQPADLPSQGSNQLVDETLSGKSAAQAMTISWDDQETGMLYAIIMYSLMISQTNFTVVVLAGSSNRHAS